VNGVNGTLFVAYKTVELGTVGGDIVAFRAESPHAHVRTGKDRELGSIVIDIIPPFTRRMAIEAVWADIAVSRHTGMDQVGGGLFMTGQAVKNRSVGGHGMAVGALGPNSRMRASVYREISEMFGELTFLSVGVTRKTILAVVHVT